MVYRGAGMDGKVGDTVNCGAKGLTGGDWLVDDAD